MIKRKFGSEFKYRIPASRVESGKLSRAETAAVDRTKALRAEVGAIANDALGVEDGVDSGFEFPQTPKPGRVGSKLAKGLSGTRSSDLGVEVADVSTADDGASVTVHVEKGDGGYLNSYYGEPEAQGLKGQLGDILTTVGQHGLFNHSVYDLGEKLRLGSGPKEQKLSRAEPAGFEFAVVHNDGGITYSSSKPDPSKWNILK